MKKYISSLLAIIFLIISISSNSVSAIVKKELKTKDIAKKNVAVVQLKVYDNQKQLICTGSGFFISSDGKIATNYHVIENASSVEAVMSNKRSLSILCVLGYNKNIDIAVLKSNLKAKVQYVSLGDSDEINIGDDIVAIGSPLGLQNTVSTGIISSIRDINNLKIIQISAPISHGSSGGVLFNMYGEAIGITSSTIEEGQNLNFAIPINYLKKLYQSSEISFSQIYDSEHTIVYDNGAKYEGDIKNSIPDGYGIITWSNGDKYIGNWVNGNRTGKGKYTWNDGNIYEGDFLDNVMTGYGKFSFISGNSYEGDLLNGKMHGNGTYTYSDGSKYIGIFENNIREGKGVYVDASGNVYESVWENDLENGKGTLTMKNGEIYDFEYDNGKLISSCKRSSIQSQSTKPYPPIGVRARSTSSDRIEIGWDKVSGADYYYVYTSSNYNGTYYYFSDENGNKKQFFWTQDYSVYTDGLKPGTTQYYKVTAVKNGSESDFSFIVSATTLPDNSTTETQKIIYPLHLRADDKDKTYLGKLTTNTKDIDSVFNEYGTYGSKYGLYSIWNEYGTYGGKYSLYSPFNPYSITPPLIVDNNGSIVGRLSLNKYVVGVISPYDIKSLLIKLGQ